MADGCMRDQTRGEHILSKKKIKKHHHGHQRKQTGSVTPVPHIYVQRIFNVSSSFSCVSCFLLFRNWVIHLGKHRKVCPIWQNGVKRITTMLLYYTLIRCCIRSKLSTKMFSPDRIVFVGQYSINEKIARTACACKLKRKLFMKINYFFRFSRVCFLTFCIILCTVLRGFCHVTEGYIKRRQNAESQLELKSTGEHRGK